MPRSDRTQRTFDLSHDPDEGLLGQRLEPLGRVKEQHEGLVCAELGLHLRDGHGCWARQRGVIREVLGELPVDLGEAGVDGARRSASTFSVSALRFAGASLLAAMSCLSFACHSLTRSCRSRTSPAS